MQDQSVDRRLTQAFLNILSQCPGQQFGSKTFKLVAVEADTYLLLLQGTRCTVFTVYPELCTTLPVNERQCSVFEYLCLHQIPDGRVKDQRFAFDMGRRYPQGARNFATRVTVKFNLESATTVFSQMGGRS